MAMIVFYVGESDEPVASVVDGAIPREGEFFYFREVHYRIDRVLWSLGQTAPLVADVMMREVAK